MQPIQISEAVAEHFTSVFSSPQCNGNADVTNENNCCAKHQFQMTQYWIEVTKIYTE